MGAAQHTCGQMDGEGETYTHGRRLFAPLTLLVLLCDFFDCKTLAQRSYTCVYFMQAVLSQPEWLKAILQR